MPTRAKAAHARKRAAERVRSREIGEGAAVGEDTRERYGTPLKEGIASRDEGS